VRCVTKNKKLGTNLSRSLSIAEYQTTILSTYTCAELHMGGYAMTINISLLKNWW
jgi:hypothetical protein